VHVVVDDVVRRRWGHIPGRCHPSRNRSIDRHGQHEKPDGRWGRRENHELGRRRRKEKDRRRWQRRKGKHRIAEHKHRPADEHDLLGRRRRNVIGDRREGRGRLECGRKKCKPAMRVRDVRPFGIAPQI
jgi:hypothetical protein